MAGMNAIDPKGSIELAAADPTAQVGAFELRRAGPEGRPPPTPLVFASPHSGRLYPEDMMSAVALDAMSIRRSEDAFVDDLIAGAPDHGATVIAARYARSRACWLARTLKPRMAAPEAWARMTSDSVMPPTPACST